MSQISTILLDNGTGMPHVAQRASQIESINKAASMLLSGCTPSNPVEKETIVLDLMDIAAGLAHGIEQMTSHETHHPLAS